MAYETAKPNVVTTPTSLPPCSNASGISEESHGDATATGGLLAGLLDQVERHRADQYAGTETQDHPDRPQAEIEPERNQRSDDQRGPCQLRAGS